MPISRLGFLFLCLGLALIVGVVLGQGFNYFVTCPTCEGVGEVWGEDYDFDDGNWVVGYRECGRCDGTGLFWLHSASYSTLFVSFLSILVFSGLWFLGYALDSLRLDKNPWVRDVKEMGFWGNPMYSTWLFYNNRKKWAKWTAFPSLLSAIIIAVMFGSILYGSSNSTYLITRITPQVFWEGCIFGIVSSILFASGLYLVLLDYISS